MGLARGLLLRLQLWGRGGGGGGGGVLQLQLHPASSSSSGRGHSRRMALAGAAPYTTNGSGRNWGQGASSSGRRRPRPGATPAASGTLFFECRRPIDDPSTDSSTKLLTTCRAGGGGGGGGTAGASGGDESVSGMLMREWFASGEKRKFDEGLRVRGWYRSIDQSIDGLMDCFDRSPAAEVKRLHHLHTTATAAVGAGGAARRGGRVDAALPEARAGPGGAILAYTSPIYLTRPRNHATAQFSSPI